MNYIGSKYSLLDFLDSSINDVLLKYNENKEKRDIVFADLFAGTGVVSAYFKKKGYSVISNDIQYYSYVLIKNLVENSSEIDLKKCMNLIDYLNNLDGVDGFIYENYSLGGTKNKTFQRMYFTDYNAKKCDAIRLKIEELKNNFEINDSEYYFLLSSLICSIDKYANTASVYGAFLKKIKKSASKQMVLQPTEIIGGTGKYLAFNDDANDIIKKIEGDILYLDPPYNARQYCTNYHILETIAKYDNPQIKGKTGLRNYEDKKSEYCSKSKVKKAFEDLIKNSNFKYIFLSYNNEGLMSFDEIKEIMSLYGDYYIFSKEYRRFKADNARMNKTDSTIEYLHCLVKEN